MIELKCAAVAELADAMDSKSIERKLMRVQVSPAAQEMNSFNVILEKISEKKE